MKRVSTAFALLVVLLLAACDSDSTIQQLARENQELRQEVEQITEINQELQTQTAEIARIIEELQSSVSELGLESGGSETGGSVE